MFEKFISENIDLTEIVHKIKTYDHIIFFGIGGSSLVGQALKEMTGIKGQKLFFFDTIDPKAFRENILPYVHKNTFFIVISKSGNTSETLTQTISIAPYVSNNILVITENKSNALREMAHHYSWSILECPSEIGGRFSAFTIVGLLPCILLDLSPKLFIKGAHKAIKEIHDIQQKIENIYKNFPIQQTVLLSYSNYTHYLLSWMSQLISESLGKCENAITPIIARGTFDQHSQLQLWLDGPKNKIFEIYYFHDEHDTSHLIVDTQLTHPALLQLKGLSYGHIFKSHCLATKQALINTGYHVTFKEYNKLDEYVIGYLMMEKIIEVFHLAKLMGINPEGQPGVEKSKQLIGAYL